MARALSSDAFYNSDEDAYDVLLVDEAHRLVRHSGLYGNRGDNQISEIIRSARVAVFFLDESQRVTWRDIGTADAIDSAADANEAPVESYSLTAQFRCAGSNEYLDWLDATLSGDASERNSLAASDYEIRLVDSPSELRDIIFSRDRDGMPSRILAGYCWDWISKRDPEQFDIVFPGTDFAMRWNFTGAGMGWIISQNSVHEVGCIHTCQGLETDYMGVIIGPDLIARGGRLVTDPGARARTDASLRGWKNAAKIDRVGTLERADQLIRNTYRTLLSRGMRGTFIFCTDSETQEWFADRLASAALRSEQQ